MRKIIAKEVAPYDIDFSYYFDSDSFTNASGKNCACYIPGNRDSHGFNSDEYKNIVVQADSIIEGFDSIENGYGGTFKAVMQENDITYTSRKCYLLKLWAKTANTNNSADIAEFLTITTGEKWNVRSFTGYSQGDYCEVIYCTEHYSDETITEVGKFWLGCGTEFSIDNCYGYFVTDDIRWEAGEALKKTLAGNYGCNPEELEVYLYKGEHRVADYELLEVS